MRYAAGLPWLSFSPKAACRNNHTEALLKHPPRASSTTKPEYYHPFEAVPGRMHTISTNLPRKGTQEAWDLASNG